jgi:hypothetical protein
MPRLALDAFVLLIPVAPMIFAEHDLKPRMVAFFLAYNIVGAAVIGASSGILW